MKINYLDRDYISQKQSSKKRFFLLAIGVIGVMTVFIDEYFKVESIVNFELLSVVSSILVLYLIVLNIRTLKNYDYINAESKKYSEFLRDIKVLPKDHFVRLFIEKAERPLTVIEFKTILSSLYKERYKSN